jgi:cytochrome c-type biogenesis protein CcmH
VNLLATLLLTARLSLALDLSADDAAFDAVREPPAGPVLTDEASIDAETDRVASVLRCPVCQGMSVAESREGLSLAMKQRIRELVTAGYTQTQIIDYFVERYGESIVLLPDEDHWIVWLGPVAAGLIGLGIVGWQLRRRSTPADTVPTPTVAAGPDDDYRRRVLAELEDV